MFFINEDDEIFAEVVFIADSDGSAVFMAVAATGLPGGGFEGSFAITGGTGRFEEASGGGFISGQTEAGGRFTFALDGEIDD